MHVLSLFCISLEMMMGTIEGLLDKKKKKFVLMREMYSIVFVCTAFDVICIFVCITLEI